MGSNLWIDWDKEPLLGKVPDTALAKARGISRQAVHTARKARGIPACPRDARDNSPKITPVNLLPTKHIILIVGSEHFDNIDALCGFGESRSACARRLLDAAIAKAPKKPRKSR